MLLSAMGVMGQAHSHFLTQPDTHLWLALLDCLALEAMQSVGWPVTGVVARAVAQEYQST